MRFARFDQFARFDRSARFDQFARIDQSARICPTLSLFRVEKPCNIDKIVQMLLLSLLWDLKICCLPSLGETGEPYQGEGEYLCAEEYAHLCGGHCEGGLATHSM
jgi:hypothetical protein